MSEKFYEYLDDQISFKSQKAVNYRTIYSPLCGVDASSLKSSITPFLSGDIKIDKAHYLTKPSSTEDLREDVRNFFVMVNGQEMFAINRESKDCKSEVEVGPFWHKLTRHHSSIGLSMQALSFIPVNGDAIELTQITLSNDGQSDLSLTPTAVVPIFGRSLANKHDHEHVTSLLHRIEQVPQGVLVKPTMKFNEEGHKPDDTRYFVFGCDDHGATPAGSFPTMASFLGDGGIRRRPEAIMKNLEPAQLSEEAMHGKEAYGALRFSDITLKPGEKKHFIIGAGIAPEEGCSKTIWENFNSVSKIKDALDKVDAFWKDKANSITFKTQGDDFNSWMRWVTLQPVLRRIFGCSFLPDHDYGKGGKGWRDLWQDLLSLILIEPEQVRESLLNNFAGIRIDGSNATIIGAKPGEFIADRNAITRVWMDHGAWPLLTTQLYINQTGDYDFLFENTTYFRDLQLSRTYKKDQDYSTAYGNHLKDKEGKVYQGSVLEHLLLQNLVQFFNVGEHNLIRLESADWNDGLDMAFDRGESVAFSSFYGGNLMGLADLLDELAAKGTQTISLAKEMMLLLDTLDKPVNYDSLTEKQDRLYVDYCTQVQPEVSGKTVDVNVSDLANDLRKKGQWLFNQIREEEWLNVKHEGQSYSWFNGYYDNKGQRVEGQKNANVWMTLTGQVFPLMSSMTTPEESQAIVKSVEKFLRDPVLGGYRLNSDFKLDHYLDLGRAFGFAFGTKENGAFFSHMIVMYAYGLYHQGLAREGYTVLKSIYDMCVDAKRAKIYPGVPEYFDSEGRGMYHYLTGSASWLVLTQLTQAFGVRGLNGNLLLDPKLVAEQFNDEGEVEVSCQFAGKDITVRYVNKDKLDANQYKVCGVAIDGVDVDFESVKLAGCVKRDLIEGATANKLVVEVILGSRA